MLRTEQLYYLLQVAKYGSINQAAEKLYMTKGAISIAMRQLEEELGFEVIKRTYRGAKLTEKGEKVLELAKQVFSIYDEMYDLKHDGEVTTIKKMDLYITRQTNNLLAKKLLNTENKVLKYFRIIECEKKEISEILHELNDNSIVITLVDNEGLAFVQEKYGLKASVLYKSKLYLVSNKKTRHLDSKCTKISAEELQEIPKVIMGTFGEFWENVVLRTDNPAVYTEAIHNDYGIGILAKYGNDISAIERSNFKFYEPLEGEGLDIVILYKEKVPPKKIQLLQKMLQ